MGFFHRMLVFVVRALPLLLIPFLFNLVGAQGLQTSPYSAADEVRRGLSPGRLDLAPSNPLGLPGSSFLGPRGSDTIPISSGMFSGIIPRISNLELGFLYNFGNNVRMGRFSADYVLPFNLSCDSVIFGEAHTEWENFWKTPTGSVTSASGSTITTSRTSNRVDLSFGGGYRTMLGESSLLGVNGFYDASRLFNTWYSSGGVGLEWAALLGDDAAIDLNVNWYGNLFSRDGLINAFRNKGGSYDIEAGYSQSLFNQAVDLRLKATGYQFDIGSAVYGWRTGADLTTRDGVFALRYEYGHDRVNGDYNTVGGFVNIGFQLENVLNGESPFTLPEPVFKSPRNLRRWLTTKVHRNWHQPTAAVLTSSSGASGGGRNCDRFLGAATVSPTGPGGYVTLDQFTAFPRTSLDPTKFIAVEFDYDFRPAPGPGATIAFLVVDVRAPFPGVAAQNFFIGVGVPIDPSGQGHMTLTLNTIGNQNTFILANQDPNGLSIDVFGATGGTTSLAITNVCIRFNQ